MKRSCGGSGGSSGGSSMRHRRFATTAAAAAGGGEGSEAGKAKVAVFVSGGGSNLRALHAAMEDGRVNAEVVAVVSNAPSCGGVAWAQERDIPTLVYPPKKGEGESGKPKKERDAMFYVDETALPETHTSSRDYYTALAPVDAHSHTR